MLQANIEDPDQMRHHAASDLALHCLSMSRKKDYRLIRVKLVWQKVLKTMS